MEEIDERTIGKIVVSVVFAGMAIFVLLMLVFGVKTANKNNPKFSDYETELIAKAKNIFQNKSAEGVSMDSGPCLANELDTDWVLDVAHDPREPVDDLPENQCPSFRDGVVKHFLEIDLDGNLIRLK